MGCASSKSTPTVDTNPANTDNLGQTLLNNGKAMAMKSQEDIMHKIDDFKQDIKDTLSIGSKQNEDCDDNEMLESMQEPPSPPTERVQDEDNDMQMTDVNDISDEKNEEEGTGEHTIPITMTLNVEKMEDSAEPSEKPPTPMPE